ncbi:hypothetical protein [Methanosarcina spherical virus]|nr:ORF21 [Methanosarcina spherical virus]
MDRKSKAIIGVGVIAAAYLYMSGSKTEDVGSGGNFGGLGGGGTLEGFEGVTDSGTPYNISFPAVDPSPIIKMINDPVISGSNEVIKTNPEIPIDTTTKKSALTSSTPKETDGSLSSSLAQVFGTESQKTNDRGDYYATSAGGGAGAIKGKSIGETVIGFLTDSYKESKTAASKLPTGASTSTQYTLPSNVGDLLKADQTKKASMQEAINQTKIGAYTPVSDPLQALKDSGIVKSSSGSSNSLTTPKKTVSSSSSSSRIKRQGGSGTGESRVKIVKKN